MYSSGTSSQPFLGSGQSCPVRIVALLTTLVELAAAAFALYTVYIEKYESDNYLWIWLLVYGILAAIFAISKVSLYCLSVYCNTLWLQSVACLWMLAGLIAVFAVEAKNENILYTMKVVLVANYAAAALLYICSCILGRK